MSTPKYNLLYDAFGWEKPVYIHLPMVLGEDGQKLSKRNGDASFMVIHDGYLPEGVVIFGAFRMESEGNEEIFTLDELIKILILKGLVNHQLYSILKIKLGQCPLHKS